jgi:hypothetical protein
MAKRRNNEPPKSADYTLGYKEGFAAASKAFGEEMSIIAQSFESIVNDSEEEYERSKKADLSSKDREILSDAYFDFREWAITWLERYNKEKNTCPQTKT